MDGQRGLQVLLIACAGSAKRQASQSLHRPAPHGAISELGVGTEGHGTPARHPLQPPLHNTRAWMT
eukprot:13715758-Alexandrium_andersonii.AAC.1